MTITEKYKPLSRSGESPIDLKTTDLRDVLTLSGPTARLATYMGDAVDTPLTDDHAKEVCDRLDSKPAMNLRHRVNIYGWRETTLVCAHALALKQLESESLRVCTNRPELAGIFLTLYRFHRLSRKLTAPVVRLVRPGDRQIVKIFHRKGLLTENKHPGIIQVFCDDIWCGQIKQLNPVSVSSTCFCHTSLCPEWVEGLILRFANHPPFVAKNITG